MSDFDVFQHWKNFFECALNCMFCKHHFFPPKADQGAISKVCNSKWQHFVRTVISSLNFDFILDNVDLTNLQGLGYFKFLYGSQL